MQATSLVTVISMRLIANIKLRLCAIIYSLFGVALYCQPW